MITYYMCTACRYVSERPINGVCPNCGFDYHIEQLRRFLEQNTKLYKKLISELQLVRRALR